MSGKRDRRDKLVSRAVQVTFLVTLVLLWYFGTTRWGINPLLLPNPVKVWAEFKDILSTGEFLPDLQVTLSEIAIAFLISCSSGVTIGYLISRSQYLMRVFEPLLAGMYSIPIILFLPLFVLFFGLGPGSKIAIGATISFFPIVLNTIAGFGYVDRIFITAARSMGASDVQMFRYVLLPAAFPVILTGLRIGFTVALLSILGSETLASLAGLGHRIVHLAEAMETARMFAYIAFVVAIAATLNTTRQRARTPVEAAAMSGTAQLKRFFLRRPGLVRLGVVLALFLLWEIAGALLDRADVPEPAVEGHRQPRRAVRDQERAGRRFRSRSGSWRWRSRCRSSSGSWSGSRSGCRASRNRSFMPIILLLYGTPQVTILPLFILYFGIGPASKIAFGVSHGIFPIIVTIVAGVQNIKPILMTAARSMGASRWQIFRWVIFPHMIPSFFAGMRLGMTGVLLGVLLAELYVSTAGIGYFTQLFTQNFDPTKLLGLISVLAAMAIVLNEIVRRAEVHFGKWRTD